MVRFELCEDSVTRWGPYWCFGMDARRVELGRDLCVLFGGATHGLLSLLPRARVPSSGRGARRGRFCSLPEISKLWKSPARGTAGVSARGELGLRVQLPRPGEASPGQRDVSGFGLDAGCDEPEAPVGVVVGDGRLDRA